jgi:hypothetical protein
MKKLSSAEIEECVKSNRSFHGHEAFWDFSNCAEYERLLGVSVDACCNLLQDAGLQSLGKYWYYKDPVH